MLNISRQNIAQRNIQGECVFALDSTDIDDNPQTKAVKWMEISFTDILQKSHTFANMAMNNILLFGKEMHL